MATELQLDIVTPQKSVYSGKVLQVVLPAWEGEEGVYPEHDGKLALLRGGITTLFTSEGQTRYVTGRGFAEIGAANVTLLTDSCELASEIDKPAARAAMSEADTALEGVDWISEAAHTLRVQKEILQAKLDA